MRNFEERKAEIFRRSENRIIGRKRTVRKVMFGCLPLFICITVFSVLYLPGRFSNMEDKISMEDVVSNMMPVVIPETIPELLPNEGDCEPMVPQDKPSSERAVKIEVYGSDSVSFTLTSKESIALVEEIIAELSAKEDANDGDLYDTPDGVDIDEYTIVLTYDNQQETTYRLIGNIMIAVESEQRYQLTPKRLDELMNTLGIS